MSEIVVEVWADSGETVARPMTEQEQQQREADAEMADAAAADKAAREKAIEQARNAAIKHAKTLGFTDEMIAVIYPTLVSAQ